MQTPVNNVSVSLSARTDVGRHRRGNEDAFLVADLTTGKTGLGSDIMTHRVGERGSLLIVSDGMGGAAAGEVASELAVKTICESMLEFEENSDLAGQLKTATEVANARIWDEAQRNSELSGMGATVTAALVRGAVAFVAQVGDSRAYLIRGDRIKQITKDQSFVQALLDKGIIKPEQAASVPQNVIMQALGTRETVQVVMTCVELMRDDRLVLCSDGLSGKIKPDEIRETVLESADITAACRRLVDKANERGGEDNITVVVARFDGVGLDAANESNSITDSFRSLSRDYLHEEELTGTDAPAPEASPTPQELRTILMPSLASAGLQQADATEAAMAVGQTGVEGTVIIGGLRESRAETERSFAGRAKSRRAVIILLSIIILLLLSAAGYLIYRLLEDRP